MDCIPFQEGMIMHRFYADSSRSTDTVAFLTQEDARHALTVLRLKTGRPVEIILNGSRFEAELNCDDARNVYATIIAPLPSTEAALSITLFQGLPKADRMDLVVQKSTELGVCRIVPVLMSRCIVHPDPKDKVRKLERWRKIAREAGKQSGRCVIPEITEPVVLEQLPDAITLPGTNIVPWEEETPGFGPLAFSEKHPGLRSLGILIGPEGGIEKEEVLLLQSAGFIPITLGKRILRTETAGPAAISSFLSLYGEME